MNPVIKAVILGILNYLVYTYILIPVSTPTMEEIQEEGKLKNLEDSHWQEEDLFWFIQVSDLHISRYVYPDLKDDLREFFSTTLDIVKPGVLLVSGDLTDAKDEDGVNSFQQLEEWETYRDLLQEYNVTNKTIYLDIRGNHDSFDVFDYKDKQNLHLTHSKMGPLHPSSYITTISHHNRTISFVAMDATLNPGPKKVFNFLGHLTESHIEQLRQLKKEAAQSDYQVFFGHFPLSCMVPSSEAKSLVEGGLTYLSGHLHTLGGLAPRIYSLHRSGTPEFELGDWKENRVWRLLAIDNGHLSFSDQRHNQDWPLILVTNPKNSLYLAPQVESVDKILTSTKIRVLVFSQVEVTSVLVRIDSEDWMEMKAGDDEGKEVVYTRDWDPQDYAGSQGHTLTVRVTMMDDFGESSAKELSQKFVVETSGLHTLQYSLYARLLLMTDVYTVLQFCWVMACLFCLVPPVMARFSPGKLTEVMSPEMVLRMRLFCSNDYLFYMYVFTGLYVTFGPWHVGEILTGHVGFIFAWGTLVRGSLLPSFYPYIFSLFHLTAFHFPLLWSLLYKLDLRSTAREESRTALALSNIPVTLVLSLQACMLLLLYLFPSRLGIFKEIALLLAPVEITTIIIGFSLNGVVSYKIRDNRRSGRRF